MPVRNVLGLQPSKEEEKLRPVPSPGPRSMGQGMSWTDMVAVLWKSSGGWPGGGAPVALHGTTRSYLNNGSRADNGVPQG